MRHILLALIALTLLLAACNSAGDTAASDDSDRDATPPSAQPSIAAIQDERSQPQETTVFDAAAETAPPIGSWLPVHFARNPDRVRTDVTAAFAILRDGALPPVTTADHIAENCPSSTLAHALLGDTIAPRALDRTATLDVLDVNFLNDRQAHITTRVTTANGALVLENPDGANLWVFQSGRWRATGDCPRYATIP